MLELINVDFSVYCESNSKDEGEKKKAEQYQK